MTSERLLIHSRYDVEPRTRGGMAHVYEGVDTRSGHAVIVKAAATSDFERAATLVRERETLVRLKHEGIVRCLDLLEENGETCLVLEKIPGTDLGETLRMGDLKIDEARARDWAIQLARILRYLHAQAPPVIYRDMKPANVILRPDGKLVLVDFGATRVLTGAPRDTVALGTPGYAPPEQYAAATDERADIYALGATLHELLTRRDPAQFNFRLPPPSELGVRLSKRFEATLMRMVDPDPAKRYPSVDALLGDLQPTPALAVPALAALAAVAVATLPIPNLGRYAIDAALCGLVAFAVARRTAPLSVLAVLAAVPLALHDAEVNAWLRRFSLELGLSSVPLEAPPVAWTVLGVWLVVLGWAVGQAFTRPRGWTAALAVLLLGFCSVAVLKARVEARDAGAPAAVEADAPLWTQTLGVRRAFHTWMYPTANALAVRYEPDRFQVLDADSGRVLWSDACNDSGHMSTCGSMLVQLRGNEVLAREIRDGAVRWRYTAPAPVREVWYDVPMAPGALPGIMYMRLEDGAITAVVVDTHKPKWSWRAPFDTQILMRSGEHLLVASRKPTILHGLRVADGQPAWTRPLQGIDAGFHFFPSGNRWVWLTSAAIEGLDPSTGGSLFRWSLPVGMGGPDHPEALEARPHGENHLMVMRHDALFQIDLGSGATVWQARLPGESARLNKAHGVFHLTTRSGRMIGLEARSGRATWEWWSNAPGFEFTQVMGLARGGAPGPHQGPPGADAYLFQAVGSNALRVFEPETGQAYTWRNVDPGMRVERVSTGYGRTFLCGVDAQQRVVLQALRAGRFSAMGYGF